MMKRIALVALVLAALGAPVVAADHVWRRGIWRGIEQTSQNGGAISLPMGGTPPTTIAGVAVGGTAPTYLSIPLTDEAEVVVIDSPDGLRYVAKWHRHFHGIIINDPIDFAVEGDHLFVRGLKPGDVHKLSLVSTTRLEPK